MNRYIFGLLGGVAVAAVLLLIFVHTAADDEPEHPTVSTASPSLSPQVRGDLTGNSPDSPRIDPGSAPSPASSATLPPADPTAPNPVVQTASPAVPAQSPDRLPDGTARPASPARSGPSLTEQGKLTDISLHFRAPGMVLRLEADRPLQVKTFLLTQPNRLVVDLPGRWQGVKTPAVPGNNLVKSARIGRQNDGDRLVLDLARPLKKHEVTRLSDSRIEIYFARE